MADPDQDYIRKSKKKFLPPLCKGAKKLSLAEESSTSDAAALETSAQKVAGGWKLNGNKLWQLCLHGETIWWWHTVKQTACITAFMFVMEWWGFSYGKMRNVKVSPTWVDFPKLFCPWWSARSWKRSSCKSFWNRAVTVSPPSGQWRKARKP